MRLFDTTEVFSITSKFLFLQITPKNRLYWVFYHICPICIPKQHNEKPRGPIIFTVSYLFDVLQEKAIAECINMWDLRTDKKPPLLYTTGGIICNLHQKLGGNRAHGAGTRAGTAVNAFGGVNYSFTFGFGYCRDGARRLASAAVDAGFGVNFICHF